MKEIMLSDIAVILPYYNAENTIIEAVDSVLSSVVPVDLIIIDDGSKKPLTEILQQSENCEIIRFSENKGLIAGLNYGLQIAQKRNYKYIARMDADDICDPERFSKQRAFMEENEDIALVGTWAVFINELSKEPVFWYSPPTEAKEITKALANNSVVLHPTWFMRSEMIIDLQGYKDTYCAAEDYDFLYRLSKTKLIANIPEYLLKYRISGSGISVANRKRQLKDRLSIQFKQGNLFSIRVWVGIFRTLLLLIIPMQILTSIKQKLYKKSD